MNATKKTTARHVLISLNPKAGRTSPTLRAERLRDLLTGRGFTVKLLTDLDEVARQANELHESAQLRALIGVGGDGTAAELTNRTQPGTPITLLPAGTANLIAKEFRLPASPDKAARMIETGSTLTLDAGRANGRLFLVMLSAGIDADIVDRVHRKREENYRQNGRKGGHIGYHSYIEPIFASIRNYSYPRIEIHFDPLEGENEERASFRWAFIFNIPRYGFGVPLTPNCIGDDRKLDFCGFKRRGLFAALSNVFFAQIWGLHRFLPNVRLRRGIRFQFVPETDATLPPQIPYQLDGDPGGFLPVEIETVPNRLTLLVPDGIAKRFLKAKETRDKKIQKKENYVLAPTRKDVSDVESRVLSDHP